MNIIKLKDQPREGDTYFNTHLRGKYAWWVRQMFVVAFEELSQPEFSQAEQTTDRGLQSMVKDTWYDVLDIMPFVDSVETNRINDIASYIEYNEKTPEADLTIDDLKRFRTWLAEELLKRKDLENDVTLMLKYYAAAMWDDAIAALSMMSSYTDVQLQVGSGCACGCGSSLTLAELYGNLSSSCDSLGIYRKAMYNLMVMTFSNLDFWLTCDSEFIKRFKDYVDNILKLELIPTSTSYVQPFADCGCTTDISNNNRALLEKLAQALDYLLNCGLSGHKNFIRMAFADWATYLYELMYWE